LVVLFISCRSQDKNDNKIETNNSPIDYEIPVDYETTVEQSQESIRPTPGIVARDALENYGLLLALTQVTDERERFTRRYFLRIDGTDFLFIPDESFFPWDNIARVYSSSQAEGYGPENLLNRTWQSWAVSGGIGESFTVEFNIPIRLDRFMIRNGNGNIEHYFQNNRVKAFEIFLDDEETGKSVSIRDTHELASYGFPHLFMPEFFPDQVIMNGTYVKASKVTFKITELFYGTQHDNTFIAEFFFGAPTLWGPEIRFQGRNQINSPSSLLMDFKTDPYTTSLIRAMYEGYDIRTRLNSDKQLEIYASPSFDDIARWYTPDLSLTGEVAHKFFRGTGAGQSGHSYRIFLSPDFPPILVILSWDTTSMMYWESELQSIQLFDGSEWVDHNDNPATLPILRLKEEIEERGLLAQFSFSDHDERGSVVFGGPNSLVIHAAEIVRSDEGWSIGRNILETHKFLWNGEEFAI
jgi:hypothetical protein